MELETERKYIEISCPNCKLTLKVREEHWGQRGRCKYCQNSFVVGGGDNVAESPIVAPAAQRTDRRGLGVIGIGFAILFAVIVGGQAYKHYQESILAEGDRWVYFSGKDRYYYYDLCPRALSLGLNDQSKQYRESELLSKGYTLVPFQWRDLDAEQQKIEAAKLAQESARLAQEAAKAKAEYDASLRQQPKASSDSIQSDYIYDDHGNRVSRAEANRAFRELRQQIENETDPLKKAFLEGFERTLIEEGRKYGLN